jgi:hypothetical protein
VYPDKLIRAENEGQSTRTEVSPLLPNTTPVLDDPSSTNNTRIKSVVTSTHRRGKNRPPPTRKAKLSAVVAGSRKRKHTSGNLSPICDREDSESEKTSYDSGDGSSSGESISSDAPMHRKRQRTSQIATRSSVRTPASRTTPSPSDAADASLPADADTPLVETGNTALTDNASTGDAVISNANSHVPPNTNAEGPIVIDTDDLTHTDINESDVNANGPVSGPAATDTDVRPVPSHTAATAAIHGPTEAAPPSPSSPASWNDIDESCVPAFLLRHGKGKREVNIFKYLHNVEDPHFQQVLLHYLHFEMNAESGVAMALPTGNRPVEIGQWTSRARPAIIPNYTAGGRTFKGFTDSVLAWWASIQPSWRTFERGSVSREVKGGWDVLRTTRINGLLNIVILVYWWVRILEEEEPEGGVRADYEIFAEDVAWVFSNLATTTSI